jgi:ABC-type antimicrobial peptide transport system permease subunit
LVISILPNWHFIGAVTGKSRFAMFKNYFRTALRNFLKSRMFSIINISGLSLGMAIALLIGIWIWDELSFDTYHSNYRQIAQVMENQSLSGGVTTMGIHPYPLTKALRDNYSGDFERVAAFIPYSQMIAVGNKKLTRGGSFTDADFPEMMTLRMRQGSRTGLSDPSSILISGSLATAVFGDADPIGKTLKLGDKYALQVKGVYEDLPGNSSFKGLDYIAPMHLLFDSTTQENDWYTNAYSIYVQLKPGSDPAAVSARIAGLMREHDKSVVKPVLFLYPMSQWHLYSEFKNGIAAAGNIQYCWMFGFIGAFILLLASINFMNLTTARSDRRAKEVGIRKAIGSARIQLITQFFSESFFMVLCAFVLSLLLAWLLLPFFNELAGKKMTIPWYSTFFWLCSLLFITIMGFLTGSYPALYLSSFNAVKVLKGGFQPGRNAAIPRKVLVVLQFTICIGLSIATMVVYRQIQFAKDRPLGFLQNGLITIPLNSPQVTDNYDAFRNELLKSGAVSNVAESSSPTTGIFSSANNMVWKGKDPNNQSVFGTISSSSEFGSTIGWTMDKGRDFSAGLATDSQAFVLNEAAVKVMGFTQPIGERIHWHGKDFTVIGVAKDMVMTSPFLATSPTVFMMNKERGMNVILIKLPSNQSPARSLALIESIFKQFNPDALFQYQFEDEQYAQKFATEQRIGSFAGGFALLALFISCIGIFGMASFVAEQRRKEIGVRKVLGASVINLWRLLSREFILLVLISLVIAAPLAYHFMDNWLQHYAYHTTISWWLFALAGLGVVVITLLTVSYQTIKAALTNPVKSLRTE